MEKGRWIFICMHFGSLEQKKIKKKKKTGKLGGGGEKLHGTEIFFAGKSVGATEQAVLTAVSASGKTRIYNCAKEPEIIWLCRFLKKM